MLKKTFFTSALCMLALLTASISAQAGEGIDTNVVANWKIDAKPLDIVHTLDNKRVFILGDDSKVHIFSATGINQGSIDVDKGVTSIDIAPRGEMLYLANTNDNTFSALTVSFVTQVDVTGSPFLGNENAPVVIALFSDFQWPYCGTIQPTIEQVLEKNPQTVKIAFKNMPLTNIHNMAEPAARAGIAAHKQGKFWQMHDELFAMKSISQQSILDASKKISLDMEAFNRDFNSAETRQKLSKDMMDARAAEVSGTPTLFINGRRVSDRSPQGLQKMIDQELAKAKK